MSLDFQRLEQVLAEAAVLPDAAQRAACLTQACGDDQALRTEVERLLAANEKAGDFLETPAVEGMQNVECRMQTWWRSPAR